MSIYKISKFQRISAAAGVSINPNNHTSSMKTSMESVLRQTNVVSGLWNVVKCLDVAGGDSSLAKNHFYIAFFGIDSSGNIIGSIAAAPCPPFCTDDSIR